jgi:hypothetical protein
LRQLLPPQNAIAGIDLADCKQAVVVADHDSRVIARRRVTARAWELGELLDWAVGRAKAAGFESVTVACEPTGHRWRVLAQLAAGRGLALVCVQPLLVYRAREGEDLTSISRTRRTRSSSPGSPRACTAMSPGARTRCGPGCGTWALAGCS